MSQLLPQLPDQIRLLLLDDEPIVRTTLRYLLADTPDLTLVGSTGNIAELPQLLAETLPHILLIWGGGKFSFL